MLWKTGNLVSWMWLISVHLAKDWGQGDKNGNKVLDWEINYELGKGTWFKGD